MTNGSPFDHALWRRANADRELIDELNRGAIVSRVAEEVMAGGSRIVGVYGSWGAGKTFLLDLVARRLRNPGAAAPSEAVVTWFNPWRYELEDALTWGLVSTLARTFDDVGEGDRPEDRQRVARSAKAVWHILSRVGGALLPGAEVAVEAIEAGIEAAAEDRSPLPPAPGADTFNRHIETLVDGILGRQESNRRLIVLIDDLDRCAPGRLVGMLEWLKVHLLVPRCTYVLALDHVAAARAVVGHYRGYLDDDENLSYGLRYLEKLVDVEFEIGPSGGAETMAVRRGFPDLAASCVSDVTWQGPALAATFRVLPVWTIS